MKQSEILSQRMKRAKSFQEFALCVDDMLRNHGGAGINPGFFAQSALRHKPPKDSEQYTLLERGLGDVMFPGEGVESLFELSSYALSSRNTAWISALLDHRPHNVVSCLQNKHKILSWPRLPRSILYKIQDQLFINNDNPHTQAPGLVVNSTLLKIMWENHPRIMSRLGDEHVQMLEQAQKADVAIPMDERFADLSYALSILKRERLGKILDPQPPTILQGPKM